MIPTEWPEYTTWHICHPKQDLYASWRSMCAGMRRLSNGEGYETETALLLAAAGRMHCTEEESIRNVVSVGHARAHDNPRVVVVEGVGRLHLFSPGTGPTFLFLRKEKA